MGDIRILNLPGLISVKDHRHERYNPRSLVGAVAAICYDLPFNSGRVLQGVLDHLGQPFTKQAIKRAVNIVNDQPDGRISVTVHDHNGGLMVIRRPLEATFKQVKIIPSSEIEVKTEENAKKSGRVLRKLAIWGDE